MAVKPTKTIKVFTVEQQWLIEREDVDKLICEHLGIPLDNDTHVDLMEYGETVVTRTVVDRQTE